MNAHWPRTRVYVVLIRSTPFTKIYASNNNCIITLCVIVLNSYECANEWDSNKFDNYILSDLWWHCPEVVFRFINIFQDYDEVHHLVLSNSCTNGERRFFSVPDTRMPHTNISITTAATRFTITRKTTAIALASHYNNCYGKLIHLPHNTYSIRFAAPTHALGRTRVITLAAHAVVQNSQHIIILLLVVKPIVDFVTVDGMRLYNIFRCSVYENSY